MRIIRKKGSGKRIPATGIHVVPKHIKRYTIWKIVKTAIVLDDTDSTKDAWGPSNTLQRLQTSQVSATS